MNNPGNSASAVNETIDIEDKVRADLANAESRIERLQTKCRQVAYLLASAGGFEHRTKNEYILRAIAALLSGQDNEIRDMTDIPF